MTTRRVRDPHAWKGAPTLQQIRDTLTDMWDFTVPFYGSHSAAYTTTGKVHHEIVISTAANPIIVTLHDGPKDGDEVTVKQQGAGQVTIKTAGSQTIDGATSMLLIRYDAPHMIFSDAADEWSLI